MIAIGHGVGDGSLQARLDRLAGGVECSDCSPRMLVLAGFIVSLKTDSLLCELFREISYEICTVEGYGENSFLVSGTG